MASLAKEGSSQRPRVPVYSRSHPVIPKLYVPEWKLSVNRRLIIKNAELGNIPHYEHDDNLFLEKREQMSYNVEDRQRVEGRYQLPSREKMLNPPHYHHTYRYKSALMGRQ